MFKYCAGMFPMLWLSYAHAAGEGQQPAEISTTVIVLFIVTCFACIFGFSCYQKKARETKENRKARSGLPSQRAPVSLNA